MAFYLLRESVAGSETVILQLYLLITISLNNNANQSIQQALGDQMVDSIFVFHVGNENDLGVTSSHLLQGL